MSVNICRNEPTIQRLLKRHEDTASVENWKKYDRQKSTLYSENIAAIGLTFTSQQYSISARNESSES